MDNAARPVRWNLLRAAAIGAVIGLGYAVFNLWQDHVPYPIPYWLGAAIGGVVGGGVLFGLAAGLRNLVLRAR
jgi:hypothetical protein